MLFDSGIEHYVGAFHNPAMITPLITAAASLAASLHGVADRRPAAHRFRDTVYAAAALAGCAGTAFHLYNITKRPGGLCWQNLFYAAPVGAPMAMLLSGSLGFLAERVRDTDAHEDPKILGLPAGRTLAAATSAGIAGTVGEAALLHFRGAFQNPLMLAPVTIPPVAAALLGRASLDSSDRARPFTRWWLRLTAALGFLGVGLHVFGVHRQMGGWRNWRQNVMSGPPIPAPPSFTGLAIAGLAALTLLESRGE
ncbi:MAG: hypothetical protein JO111_09285 [Caulobacteraceae bacterium]|nr:hypothetical protein [Caulobacteraceae bacterium]